MLGRLIQGYTKSASSLESATEETHSRALLWPTQTTDYGRSFPSSPPSTPISSPSFRMGPFDDRGGIEISGPRDLRVVIAQDAFGAVDKQLVLFDSHNSNAESNNSTTRKASPKDTAKPRHTSQQSAHQRSRSSTLSGIPSAWARPSRDPDSSDRIGRLLECMFGTTSTTKVDSSTKMHVLSPGKEVTSTDVAPHNAASRPSVARALTSAQTIAARGSRASSDENSAEDVVLITRLFTVTLPDSKETMPARPKSGDEGFPVASPSSEDGSALKRTKLIEKRTPMYAVGLLVSLPREESRPNFSRPSSRMSLNSNSFPNSLGSDFASSWTLLEAITESLASSGSSRSFDQRIESLTANWDVILKTLSEVEAMAKIEIRSQLQMVNRQVMSSMVKTPKGPFEQRTNQRNIYITQALALARYPALDRSCKHLTRRLSMALRIPKAMTGLGLAEGHWIDEARYLLHIGGSKSQSQFLTVSLTAFLGCHTDWLEGSNSYAVKAADKDAPGPWLTTRTVVVADQRSVARRLVFLMASFLPTVSGASPFEQPATQNKSPLPTPGLPSSSPLKHVRYPDGNRSGVAQHSHRHHVSFSAVDGTQMSTSVSSVESHGTAGSLRPRPGLHRKDSDAVSVRTNTRFPLANTNAHIRKTSAADSAITPHPATSMPYFPKQDSYFPENAVADGTDSVASDTLAQILRRDSSSTTGPRSSSGSWGFLGLWSRRQTPSDGPDAPRPLVVGADSSNQPSESAPRRERSKLESMVGEAASVAIPPRGRFPPTANAGDDENLVHSQDRPPVLGTPRLRVDEEDGVVDVDIAMPGFLSWDNDDGTMSPPSAPRHVVIERGHDGPGSVRSSFSHPAAHHPNIPIVEAHVAGFLKQYHEDFVLQAVRSYKELVAEIKDSMLRQSLTLDTANRLASMNPGVPVDTWIPVGSSLVVDVCKFTVEKLTLYCKPVQERPDASFPLSPSPPPLSEKTHRFEIVPVTDADPILAEALEGMLDLSRQAQHSRVSSNTLGTPPGSLSRDLNIRPRFLRSNCRQVMAGALEQVVKSVSEDLDMHENGLSIGRTWTAQDARKGAAAHQAGNLLREGIRKWLLQAAESSH
jgi:hypothetical protein